MTQPSLQHMAMVSTLHISMIGITGKDSTATEMANQYLNTSDLAGYYSKCKINRDDIRTILTLANVARAYRRKVTRPWGQNDTRLLPSCEVLGFTDEMNNFKRKFEKEVATIQNNWPAIIDRQKIRLQSLYHADEYPAQHEVKDCFGFTYELLPVPDGSHIVLDLEKQVIEQLKAKIARENQKRMEKSMAEMWKRLHEPVARMAHICSEDKAVHKSLTGNLEETIDVLKRLNITGDRDFNDMIYEIEQRLVGWTPEQIRKNKTLKIQLGAAANDISNKLNTVTGMNQPS